MPCNCGKKKVYVVTKPDGSKVEVASLVAAINMVRQTGGHYEAVRR